MQERELAKAICLNTRSDGFCRCSHERRPWPGAWCAFVVQRVDRLNFIKRLVEEKRDAGKIPPP